MMFLLALALAGSARADSAGPPAASVALNELCRAALEHADEVHAAVARESAAGSRADEAKGGLLPRVYGEADARVFPQGSELGNFPIPFYVRPNNQEAVSLNIEQPVFAGGALWNRYKSGASAAEAAKEEHLTVRESVLLETAVFSYRLLEAREAIGQADSSLKRRTAHLDAAKRRMSAGVSTDVETSRAESDVQEALAAQIEAERIAFEARQRLLALTGVDVAGGLSVPQLPIPPAEVYETAANPEVLAAEQRAAAANEALAGKKGELIPELLIGGSYLHTEESPETILYVKDSTIGFAKLQWDIFSGGSKLAAVGTAKAVYEESVDMYNRLKRDRAADAAIARESLRQSQALVEAESARVQAARSAYATAEKRYESGLDSYLVRLDAETAFTEAEASLRRARFAEQRAVLDLHAARGTLEAALLR